MMMDIKEIMKRTEIHNLRAFLLEGLEDGEPGGASFEERLLKGKRGITMLLKKAFPDPERFAEAYESLEEALLSSQKVYMELGMKTGARLLYELLVDDFPK